MTYEFKIGTYDKETYEGKELRVEYNDYFENIEIYYHILRKYDLKGHANEAVFKDYDSKISENSYLKGHLIDCIITPRMSNDCKIQILNDLEIACEDWNSRFIREDMIKTLEAIKNDEKLSELKTEIVLYLYDFCDKYDIEYDDVSFRPFKNGFAEIKITGSNKINEQQINAIERICRARYVYGDVKFSRSGEIKNIDHTFQTKYFVRD